MSVPINLAVALTDAGWHPAAWRDPSARPGELLDAAYWIDLVRRLDSGGVDFATLEETFTIQSSDALTPAGDDLRTRHVAGSLDSVLLAARLAPLTDRIGLVPTVRTALTEPFHVSKAIATLDFISEGRAGLRVKAGENSQDAGLVGRSWADNWDGAVKITRDNFADPAVQAWIADRFGEAEDFIEVIRRLWDSWEDDAEIRDVPTGRFLDRDKVHPIDFVGRRFSVQGPSITPRPPQGQPLVTALAHQRIPYELAARQADVVFITPHDPAGVTSIIGEVRDAERRVGRQGERLKIFADLVVLLDDDHDAAVDRLQRLDDLDGTLWQSDALIFTGTPQELATVVSEWAPLGLDGFRLRPAVITHDLDRIVDQLLPGLERADLFRPATGDVTLRQRLGLPRPADRYAGEVSA